MDEKLVATEEWANIELDKKQDHENGFLSRTDNEFSFVDGTMLFTIQPTGASYDYYNHETRYTKTASDTVTISDVEGLHFIYFDDDTLTETTTFNEELITVHTLISILYWDAVNKVSIIGEERHGAIMDSATHLYNHNTFGARYADGLGLSGMTVDGNGDLPGSAQLGVNNGII